MSKFRNTLIALAGLLMLLGSFALVKPQGPDPVGQTRPVKIVNLPTEPVPVTGTTTIGGNINLAPGTTVGISGTPSVIVANSASNPLLVRDLDNPARQPFQTILSSFGDVITVPADKTLVVEFVSGRIEFPTNADPNLFFIVERPGGVNAIRHEALLTKIHSFSTVDVFNFSQPLRMYAGPGHVLRVIALLSTGTPFINITGHFVDTP